MPLRTFHDEPSVSDFSTGLLAVSAARFPQWRTAIGRAGILSHERQTSSDLELGGTLLGALFEAELVEFLQHDKTAANARNGYVTRTCRFPQGEVTVKVARDRLGLFETHLLKRYGRRIATDLEDLLALAVVSGYSDKEKLRLFSSFCRREGGDPATLKKLLAVFEPALKAWGAERMPSCVRLAIGWVKIVHHGCGFAKRIAGIRLLADDAETLLGVRAIACDAASDQNLARPLIEACSRLHGLAAPVAFAMAEDSLACAEEFTAAVSEFWPAAHLF